MILPAKTSKLRVTAFPGKTYSMFGEGAGNARGMIPRCMEEVFAQLERRAKVRRVFDLVRVPVCEIVAAVPPPTSRREDDTPRTYLRQYFAVLTPHLRTPIEHPFLSCADVLVLLQNQRTKRSQW